MVKLRSEDFQSFVKKMTMMLEISATTKEEIEAIDPGLGLFLTLQIYNQLL